MKKLVYLPMEFSGRELMPKLLLARKLNERGVSVCIGQQWAIFGAFNQLPPGAVLYKSYHKIYWEGMQHARKFGHAVFACEEEIFGYIAPRVIRKVIHEGLGDLVDGIFSSGPVESEILAEFKVRTYNTGNARADLLSKDFAYLYEDGIAAVKKKFGNYILINSNFGLTNSTWPSIDVVIQNAVASGVLNPKDQISVKYFQDALNHENACKEIIAGFLRYVSRTRKKSVIVRPHPGEALPLWQQICSGLENVHIIREGGHQQWTFGSDLLVHAGCTTGFEAQVAHIPAISVNPLKDNLYAETLVANYVNLVSGSLFDLKLKLDLAEAGKLDFKGELDATSAAYTGADGRTCADAIADVLAAAAEQREAARDLSRVRWNPDVPQLKQKCDVSLEEASQLYNAVRPGSDVRTAMTQVANSLFLIEPV